MMKKWIRRYGFFMGALVLTILVTVMNQPIGWKAFTIAGSSFRQMISFLPPIMVLLGLMDVWVPRETMMKYMGQESGVIGVVLSILIGSLAAGPMYASFPFTAVLLQKGVRFSNIIIFMNAWCVTKLSTLMFEWSSLGTAFTFTRLLIDLPGVILMGYVVEWMFSKNELEYLYQAQAIDTP